MLQTQTSIPSYLMDDLTDISMPERLKVIENAIITPGDDYLGTVEALIKTAKKSFQP